MFMKKSRSIHITGNTTPDDAWKYLCFFVNRIQLAANALDPQPVLYSVKNYSYNADD